MSRWARGSRPVPIPPVPPVPAAIGPQPLAPYRSSLLTQSPASAPLPQAPPGAHPAPFPRGQDPGALPRDSRALLPGIPAGPSSLSPGLRAPARCPPSPESPLPVSAAASRARGGCSRGAGRGAWATVRVFRKVPGKRATRGKRGQHRGVCAGRGRRQFPLPGGRKAGPPGSPLVPRLGGLRSPALDPGARGRAGRGGGGGSGRLFQRGPSCPPRPAWEGWRENRGATSRRQAASGGEKSQICFIIALSGLKDQRALARVKGCGWPLPEAWERRCEPHDFRAAGAPGLLRSPGPLVCGRWPWESLAAADRLRVRGPSCIPRPLRNWVWGSPGEGREGGGTRSPRDERSGYVGKLVPDCPHSREQRTGMQGW
jgi:hypothetical protein